MLQFFFGRASVDKLLDDLKKRLDNDFDAPVFASNVSQRLPVPQDVFALIEEIKQGVKNKPSGQTTSSDPSASATAGTPVHDLLVTLNERLTSLNASFPPQSKLQQGISNLVQQVWQEWSKDNKRATPIKAPPGSGSITSCGPPPNSDPTDLDQPPPPADQGPAVGDPPKTINPEEPRPVEKEELALADRIEKLQKELEVSRSEQQRLARELKTLGVDVSPTDGHLAAQNSKLQDELKASKLKLEKASAQAKEFYEKMLAAEKHNGNQSDPGGMYVASGATPLLLKESADNVRMSLEAFSTLLMEVVNVDTNAEWRSKQGGDLELKEGIKLGQPTHLQFHFERQIAEVCFAQLWDSDHYFFFPCSPAGCGVSQGQRHAHFFTLYERLRAFSDDELAGIRDTLQWVADGNVQPQEAAAGKSTIFNCEPECDSRKQEGSNCSCGASEFELFCSMKLEALKKLEVWEQFGLELVKSQDPENLTSLQDSFLNLLLDVWRLHLVSLAFEQAAGLFKVQPGQDFVEAYMEDRVMQDDKTAGRRVEFTIIPGFRVGKTVIKSLVYTTLLQQAS